MNTEPIDNILPRKANEHLQNILDQCSEAIDEVVNFGTHIVKSDIEQERDGKDHHIPTLFLRNIIELVDSISILVKQSSIDPAKIQLRSLLENHFGLLYMIEKNERKRSLSYMVWKAKRDIDFLNQLVSTHHTHKDLSKRLARDSKHIDLSHLLDREETFNILKAKKILLSKPEFIDVYREYIKTSKKPKLKYPPWYALYNGPKNFRELADYLKRSAIYEFQYRKYSENVHITDVTKALAKSGKDEAQIIQIRDFEHYHDVFSFTVSYLLECYLEYTRKRIPSMYVRYSEWRNTFLKEYHYLINEHKVNYSK